MKNINSNRLLDSIRDLGATGHIEGVGRARVAASDEDKAGRDFTCNLMKDAGMEVVVDRMGNIFGIWEEDYNKDQEALMIGSHIDSVINAGMYDGCYGVMGGIEVVRTLKEADFKPERPIVIGAFTNEEGIRYQPDMMGSLVYAGGMDVDEVLKIEGVDGTILGEELKRIGYEGTVEPGFIKPYAYLELHVEQGPILDKEGIQVGAVENLQGISWQEITITGEANHAGTTPTYLRKDAGLAAAKINCYLRERALQSNGTTVATVGTIKFEPNAINVIPDKVVFTIDLRNPNDEVLKDEEQRLKEFMENLAKEDEVQISSEQLVRFDPVTFSEKIVQTVEKSAKKRGLTQKRMTSGAGHDAQMIARIADVG
ncbi:MAG: Zn-dependent hydrolase, partial [Tissierellia bacterium]|nr:Zn-dependent hydrolase [Tissierellia bacterium]